MKIVWTEVAVNHLHAAFDYIAADNPRAATTTVEKILSVVEHLNRHPSLGHTGRAVNTRELTIPNTPFIVVYRLKSRQIEVLAVFHAARKWPDEF